MSTEVKYNGEDSIRIAREYMDSLLVESRVVGAVYPSTEMELFGRTFDTPITTGALSHQDMVGLAEGAKMANAVNFFGMGEVEVMKDVLAVGAGSIKIIKPYADENEIYSRIRAAEEFGALAVGMDVEHAACSRNAENDVILGNPMQQKSLDQLREYVQSTKLPFVIKGVLSVRDALRCLEIGCKGVILSHHNGIMKCAVPPVMVLPKIREAVGKDLKIIVDGGISSGFDAFKALALGADAVSVTKVLMGPLKEKGAEGVRDELLRLNDEIKVMMLRTDSPKITEIDPSVIWHK